MSVQVATIVNQGNLLPDQYVLQVKVSPICRDFHQYVNAREAFLSIDRPCASKPLPELYSCCCTIGSS